MREKGAVGHTYHVHEEEIRVPSGSTAPLTAAERETLEKSRRARVVTFDMFPTVMDLLGLWDAPELAPHRAKSPAEPAPRGRPPKIARSSSPNCSELFACAFKNWGAMRGNLKLIAHAERSRVALLRRGQGPG